MQLRLAVAPRRSALPMLYTIALILAILLIFSSLTSYPAESEVHNLLVVAILAALVRGIQAKGAVL